MKFDTCVKNIYNLQFSSLILKICIYDKFFLVKIVHLRL